MALLAKSEPTANADQRRAPRKRALLRGRISYSNGDVSLDCLVTQISANGARIDVKEAVILPQRFRLEIPLRGIDTQALIVRREVDHAAVAFESAEGETPESEGALRARLRVLEAENKALRANCAALQALLDRDKSSY